MLIIGGTFLVVYPAAGLIDYYRGKTAGSDQQGGHIQGMPRRIW